MSTTDTSSTPRVVVLTGVLGGIGSAIAELMHDEGYLVVGLDRCPPPDGVIPKSIDSFIQCDISKLVGDTEEAVVLGQSIVDATQKISGSNKLTALINNAAYQVVVSESSANLKARARFIEACTSSIRVLLVLILFIRNHRIHETIVIPITRCHAP